MHQGWHECQTGFKNYVHREGFQGVQSVAFATRDWPMALLVMARRSSRTQALLITMMPVWNPPLSGREWPVSIEKTWEETLLVALMRGCY